MKSSYRALVAVFITSIASGLPSLLVGPTLQAWFTQSGASLVAIGALSFVSLPYILKFLWAPLMDRYNLFSIDRRRNWLLLTQSLLLLTIIAMAFFSPGRHVIILTALAFLLAFFSASQDVVVDSYRVEILPAEKRGLGASITMLGYRFGTLISGSGAIVVAAMMNWHYMFLVMAFVMCLFMLYTWRLPAAPTPPPITHSIAQSLIIPYQELISRKYILMVVLFVLMYKLPDTLVRNFNMTFLLRHMHFSLFQVGAISNMITIVGVILGGIVAGILMLRLTLYSSLLYFGWLQLLSNLGYVILALAGKNIVVMIVTFFLENFCGGLGTVALVAYLTSLCNIKFSASQYAILSVIMTLPSVVCGPPMAVLIRSLGWIDFYVFSCVSGLPALILLWFMRNKYAYQFSSVKKATIT